MTYNRSASRLTYTMILLSVVFLNMSCQDIRTKDKNEIQELTKKYKKAIASSDGKKLLPIVSSNTINYYEKIKRLTLFASKDELLEEDLHTILLTILTKKIYPYEKLKGMDAKEFFVDGFTGQQSSFNESEDITIEEYFPNGPLKLVVKYESKSNGFPLLVPYIKENNVWKVDIPYFWKIYFGENFTPLLEKSKKEGYSKEEFILLLINNMVSISKENAFKPIEKNREWSNDQEFQEANYNAPDNNSNDEQFNNEVSEEFLLTQKQVVAKIFNLDLNKESHKQKINEIISNKNDKYSLSTRFVDLNNDGNKDLIIENLSPSYIGSGGFSTYIFILKSGRYQFVQKFFGGDLKVIDDISKNFNDLTFSHKKYLVDGGFKTIKDTLLWNGKKYN